MIAFETIETPRLLLRIVTPAVYDQLFETYTEDEIMEALGLSTAEEFQLAKTKYEGGFETYRTSMKMFYLVLKETGETIGGCGYHNWFAMHSRSEIGYHLNKDGHKRKGYMGEALAAVLAYGFSTMQLNRVEACIGPSNAASLALAGKFGFQKEGLLRQHFCKDGELQDSAIFSLLKADYEQSL